jgi:hypothetical protein
VLRPIVRSSVAVMVLMLARTASAHPVQVYFAGFSFLGEDQFIALNYPHSRALSEIKSGDVSEFDRVLGERMQRVNNPSFSLKFGELAQLGPDSPSALVLAFALDRESVSTEQIGDLHKVMVTLSAEALFVDFRTMAIVATYPVVVRYTDGTRQPPTDDDVRRIVHDLYLGKLGVNIFDDFVETLANVSLNANVANKIQVTDVEIGVEARPFLPGYLLADEANAKAFVAQQFSKALSRNQRIPVLPYVKGQAIGSKMSQRFADGRVYSLAIPKPDYAISLSLSKFKKVDYATSTAGSSFIYGSFLGVKAGIPELGKVYFDATLKYGATKVVSADQKTVEDWPAFEASLLILMEEFTKALTAPKSEWAETYAGNKAVAVDMKTFEEKLQSCR